MVKEDLRDTNASIGPAKTLTFELSPSTCYHHISPLRTSGLDPPWMRPIPLRQLSDRQAGNQASDLRSVAWFRGGCHPAPIPAQLPPVDHCIVHFSEFDKADSNTYSPTHFSSSAGSPPSGKSCNGTSRPACGSKMRWYRNASSA